MVFIIPLIFGAVALFSGAGILVGAGGLADREQAKESDIVRQGQEYLEVAETEKTKRDEIEAWRQTTLADINLKRELVIGYLDRSFDERAENFKSLFQTVDRSISTEDNYQLSLTLDAIVQLANSSPFQDLSDLSKVKAALNNPNHVWEL